MASWKFDHIEAPAELKPFVSHYLYANHALEKPMELDVLPSNLPFFMNHFSSQTPQSIYTIDGHAEKRDSRWRLGGPVFDQRVKVVEPDEIRVLFCVLKPSALFRLFGVNGVDLAGKNVCATKVAQKQSILAREIFCTDENSDQQQHIDQGNMFFNQLALNALEGDEMTEAAVEILTDLNGAISVTELCERLDVVPKTLTRRFTRIIGLTPKVFAKIQQLNWVIGLLRYDNTSTLSEVALKAGFYDQAHFSKAFQAFCQKSPNNFLKSNHLEFATYFNEQNQKGPLLALHQ